MARYTQKNLELSRIAVEKAREALIAAPMGIQAKARRREFIQAEKHLARVESSVARFGFAEGSSQ